MVRVGDIVTIDVNKYLNPGSEKTAPKRVRGKVIFVSSKGLFHTVEVSDGGNTLRYTVRGVG